MADKTISPDEKKAAIAAWHDSKTDDDRKAAVAKYPFLVLMYSSAQNFVPVQTPAAE